MLSDMLRPSPAASPGACSSAIPPALPVLGPSPIERWAACRWDPLQSAGRGLTAATTPTCPSTASGLVSACPLPALLNSSFPPRLLPRHPVRGRHPAPRDRRLVTLVRAIAGDPPSTRPSTRPAHRLGHCTSCPLGTRLRTDRDAVPRSRQSVVNSAGGVPVASPSTPSTGRPLPRTGSRSAAPTATQVAAHPPALADTGAADLHGGHAANNQPSWPASTT